VKIRCGSLETCIDCPSVICNMLAIARGRKDDGWYIEVARISELLLQGLTKHESDMTIPVFLKGADHLQFLNHIVHHRLASRVLATQIPYRW
jgi:hypothetical protein